MDLCPLCESLGVVKMVGLHPLSAEVRAPPAAWGKPVENENTFAFMSDALMTTIESELKRVGDKEMISNTSEVPVKKKGEKYPSKRCIHQKNKKSCLQCSGKAVCVHQKFLDYCRDCGGKYICDHGRRKYECGECGGEAFCEHGRRRSRCRACKGASICSHGKRKWYCADCSGTSICPHGRQNYRCKDCKQRLKSEHAESEEAASAQTASAAAAASVTSAASVTDDSG